MSLDNITIKDLKELISLFRGPTSEGQSRFNPFEIGKPYLIRTVTHIDIGVVKAVGETELILSDCSWIADTGRFYNALKDGELDEVEPYFDDVVIGRGAIVDATIWRHDLPEVQK